jgi:hypothetical protein
MRVQFPNLLLTVAAAVCFVEAAKVPKNDPGAVLTGVLGLLLMLRGLAAAPQPPGVAISAWIVVAIAVGGDEGLINANAPLWFGFLVAAGTALVFWQRIEKLWKKP